MRVAAVADKPAVIRVWRSASEHVHVLVAAKEGAVARRVACCVVVVLLSVLRAVALGDAQKAEWIGTWSMNHDGHVGTLAIRELKADCAGPVWCDMVVNYTDSDGRQYSASIRALDDRLQHLRFEIAFPRNHQPFDAYLFSWDKSKMAGTTRWGGRTFGFFAAKQ